MSVFEEMYPYRNCDSLRDFNELKRMLGEAISRGFVEEIPVMRDKNKIQLFNEKWYRDKETGDIYCLTSPGERSCGYWERVDIDDFIDPGHLIQ